MSTLGITIDGQLFEVELSIPPDRQSQTIEVLVNGVAVEVQVPSLASLGKLEWAVVGGRPYELDIDHDLHTIRTSYNRHTVAIQDHELSVTRPASADGRIKAPIPGIIVRVLVEAGQRIAVGQPVLVLEAMKMENEIHAPRAGIVGLLNVRPGQKVHLHELLAEIT